MPYADPERRREALLEAQRKYRSANRELINQRARDYRAANREKIKQHNREYRDANREQYNQRSRDSYAANRELIKQRARERYANDPEHRKQINQKWRETVGPERAHQASRNWAIANRDRFNELCYRAIRKRRARLNGVQIIAFTDEQWAAKVAYWGNRCWVCGGVWSARDHVKPIAAGGAHALCNMRPICKSCNSSKSHKWPLIDALGVHRRPPSMAA